MMMCIIASARAPSVPGMMAICSSDCSPVRVRSGSMVTIFAACALHRIENAILGIGSLLVMSDLHAQAAVRVWIFRVALHADGAPLVIHFDEHRACVGTIVRTNGANNFHFRFPAFVAAFFIESTSWPRRS